MVFVNPYSDLRFGGPFSRGGGFSAQKNTYLMTKSKNVNAREMFLGYIST